MTVSQYAKALVAALIAGLSALAPALDGGMTQAEVVIVILAAVVAGAAVFGVPNSAPAGQAADPNLSEQDGR